MRTDDSVIWSSLVIPGFGILLRADDDDNDNDDNNNNNFYLLNC
jgi:hypothetical protein